jgi:hypothetical protein
MDYWRKDSKQRVGRAILKFHSSAHQLGDGSAATRAKRSFLVTVESFKDVEEIHRTSGWRVFYRVPVPSRHDNEVARREPNGHPRALRLKPTVSIRDDVK